MKGEISLHFVYNGMGYSRFAFVVPAKAGNAHGRNAVRRKMRAVVRESLSMVEPGCDIAFIARSVEGIAYACLRETMHWLMESKGLLKAELDEATDSCAD